MDYATNRKARFNYQILETHEAGLSLNGFEVKAIKKGKANIENAFAVARGLELFLTNALIAPYQKENVPQEYDPSRARKLLMHKREISSLIGSMRQKGLALIPLRLYGKGKRGLIKVELVLAKGKRKIDKREAIRRREAEREMKRGMKKYDANQRI